MNGQSKGVDIGLMQLGQMLGQVMGQMMQQGNQGQSPYQSPFQSPTGGCMTGYFQTSDPSQLSNPCAQYVPQQTTSSILPTSSSGCDSLSQALGICGSGATAVPSISTSTSTGSPSTSILYVSPASGDAPLSVTLATSALTGSSYSVDPGDGGSLVALTPGSCSSSTPVTCVFSGTYTYQASGSYTATLEDDTGTAVASAAVLVTSASQGTGQGNSAGVLPLSGNQQQSTTTAASTTATLPPSLPNGGFGNIVLSGNGATIFGVNQNAANNSEVAGFYGSNTFNGQPQSLAGQLCQSRPWASSFVTAIIPAGFFDGICTWAGYQVGMPPPAPQPTVQLQQSTSAPKPVATSTTATTSPYVQTVPPQVQIWAVPASVPLDSRTTIFWSTQGVTQCTETSPDGSFSQNTLSGGAATVPLVAATTFTISCLDAAGNPVTNYVTVNISS